MGDRRGDNIVVDLCEIEVEDGRCVEMVQDRVE
jgi:hypothetical protein